ncbi:MAG: ABC transporter ATP-binding protein [Candidatus Micrarchaeaceae archaeon]
MEKSAVEIKNIRKTYSIRGRKTLALAGINLSIREGEVFGVLGPNGAGKTTLVRIIATLLKPDSGSVSVFGIDALNDENSVRSIIGYAGQDTEKSCYFRLTALENLVYFAYALRNIPADVARRRALSLARMFNFSGKLNRDFSALSGGEKQVVVVMRALLHRPRLCFFDEPSKSLDPLTARRMRAVIRDYVSKYNMTAILTTHNMREAEEICDRIAFIKGGKIKFVGTPDQFKKRLSVHDIIVVHEKLGKDLIRNVLRLPRVRGVEVNVNTEILSEDSIYTLPALVKMMERLGIRAKITTKAPSVEDAFIEFSRRR